MNTINRHVAKIAYSGSNADQRCVVVFMQIPKREDHALVVVTDNLPMRFEQAVMDVLRTQEAQQEETLANVFSRHLMPDTGETILEALHKGGKLLAVPVQNVLMLPQPNQPVKLTFILEKLGRLPQQQVSNQFETEKFNRHTHNQKAETAEQNRSIARGLLIEAEMLEGEAKKKRDMAYAKDPSLRTRTGPSMTETVGLAPSNDPWGDAAKMEPTTIPINGAFPERATLETAQGPDIDARLNALEKLISKLVHPETAPETEAEPST